MNFKFDIRYKGRIRAVKEKTNFYLLSKIQKKNLKMG